MRRVPGHALRRDGLPVLVGYCCGLPPDGSNQRSDYGRGHGECSCGAMSGHVHTTVERQMWHRDHKAEVLRSA